VSGSAGLLGKGPGSLFLLDYLVRPVFRREVLRMLAQGECVHQLQRAIFAGRIEAKHGRSLREVAALSGALTLLATSSRPGTPRPCRRWWTARARASSRPSISPTLRWPRLPPYQHAREAPLFLRALRPLRGSGGRCRCDIRSSPLRKAHGIRDQRACLSPPAHRSHQ